MTRQHTGTLVDADTLFLRSGKIWSSAGMDLALAIIEEDFGRALAMEMAHHMVLDLRRAGGQTAPLKHSPGGERPSRSDPVRPEASVIASSC